MLNPCQQRFTNDEQVIQAAFSSSCTVTVQADGLSPLLIYSSAYHEFQRNLRCFFGYLHQPSKLL